MRLEVLGFATAIAVAAAASPASADCTCRAPGIIASHGQTVCLTTSAGPRLARCEMVLNNSSWQFLPGACPQVSREGQSQFAAASAAPSDINPVR